MAKSIKPSSLQKITDYKLLNGNEFFSIFRTGENYTITFDVLKKYLGVSGGGTAYVDFTSIDSNVLPDVDNTRVLGNLEKSWKSLTLGEALYFKKGEDVIGLSITDNGIYVNGTLGVGNGLMIGTTMLSELLDRKQYVIADLSTIRSNASLGAEANSWGNHSEAGYATTGFVNQKVASKQNKLTAGNGVVINNNNNISLRLGTAEEYVLDPQKGTSLVEVYGGGLEFNNEGELRVKVGEGLAISEAGYLVNTREAGKDVDLSGYYTKSETDSKVAAVNTKATNAQSTADSALSKANANEDSIAALGGNNTTLTNKINEVDGVAKQNKTDIATLNNTTKDLQGSVSTLNVQMGSALSDIDKLITFYEGTDTDTTIDKWQELETVLKGLTETDNLAKILSGKADNSTVEALNDSLTSLRNQTVGISTKVDLLEDWVEDLEADYFNAKDSFQGEIDGLWSRNSFEELILGHAAADTIAVGELTVDSINGGTPITSAVLGSHLAYADGVLSVTGNFVSKDYVDGQVTDVKSWVGTNYATGASVVTLDSRVTLLEENTIHKDNFKSYTDRIEQNEKDIAALESYNAGFNVEFNDVIKSLNELKADKIYVDSNFVSNDRANNFAEYGQFLNINNGTITINGDTIKPITSHQTLYSLTLQDSAGKELFSYDPKTELSGGYVYQLTKSTVGLGNVENTALSTWKGTANITTLGTITSGTWNGSEIGQSYLDLSGYAKSSDLGSLAYKNSDTITIGTSVVSLGGGTPFLQGIELVAFQYNGSPTGSYISSNGFGKISIYATDGLEVSSSLKAYDIKIYTPNGYYSLIYSGSPGFGLQLTTSLTVLGRIDTSGDGIYENGTALHQKYQKKITPSSKLDYSLLDNVPSIYTLTIKDSSGTSQLTYTPNSAAGSITLSSAMVGLGNIHSLIKDTYLASASFTKANIKATLGISDWALAASKPTYSKDEITNALGYTPYNSTNPSRYYKSGDSPTFNTITLTGAELALGTGVTLKELDLAVAGSISEGGTLLSNKYQPIGNYQPAGDYVTSANIGTALDNAIANYGFATVATTGSYNDLSNKPTSLPASDVSAWAKAASKPSYSWSEITSKPTFATVAESGSYNDLSNTPTLGSLAELSSVGEGQLDRNLLGMIQGKADASALANYLPLSGDAVTRKGTMYIQAATGSEQPLGINSEQDSISLRFGNKHGNAWLVFNGATDEWRVSNLNWGTSYTLIHSGNIGSQSVASASKLGGIDAGSFFCAKGAGLINNEDANAYLANGAYLNQTGNGSNNTNFPQTYSIFVNFTPGQNQYVSQLSLGRKQAYYRTKIDNWGDWIEFVTSNNINNYASTLTVAAANKLSTTRTIWGKSFDGSGNVSGDLSGVGSITRSFQYAVDSDIAGNLKFKRNDTVWKFYDSSSKPVVAINGNSNNVMIGADAYSGSAKLYIGENGKIFAESKNDIDTRTVGSNNGASVSVNATDIGWLGSGGEMRFCLSGGTVVGVIKGKYTTWNQQFNPTVFGSLSFYTRDTTTGNLTERMIIRDDGNVGIGTTEPQRKLHIIGEAGTLAEFRTTNQDYVALRFTQKDGSGGYLVHYGDKNWALTNSTWTSEYKLIHSANIADYAIAKNNATVNDSLTLTSGAVATLHVGSTTFYESDIVNNKGYGTLRLGTEMYFNGNDSGSWRSASLTLKLSSDFSGLELSTSLAVDGGVTQASDARKKDIIGNTSLTVNEIANAPAVEFCWKNDVNRTKNVGTIAQYWKDVLPEIVSGEEGNMGMNYAALGVVSSIILARNIETHEQRIERLEREITNLQNELDELRKNSE